MDIKTITTEQVKARLDAGEALFLVDVREDDEVASGMIEGAVHIKMGDIPYSLDAFDTKNEYVIVCRSGARSANVCYYMQEQGFKVVNMVGGMLEWAEGN